MRWRRLPAGGGHVADLRRGAGEDGFGEHGVVALHDGVVGHVGVAGQRAEAQTAAGKLSMRLISSRLMSMTSVGRSTLSFMRSMRLVPPATKRTVALSWAVGVFWPSVMACCGVVAWTKLKASMRSSGV